MTTISAPRGQSSGPQDAGHMFVIILEDVVDHGPRRGIAVLSNDVRSGSGSKDIAFLVRAAFSLCTGVRDTQQARLGAVPYHVLVDGVEVEEGLSESSMSEPVGVTHSVFRCPVLTVCFVMFKCAKLDEPLEESSAQVQPAVVVLTRTVV